MRVTSIIAAILLLLGASCTNSSSHIDTGVSHDLAQRRKATIKDVSYELSFDLIQNIGNATISFTLDTPQEVVIDFRNTDNVIDVSAEYTIQNEHIIIAQDALTAGDNSINIEFKVDNQSLNRNEEFLYTLLVPDRARTLFPCFDQPDMKATYALELTIPNDWTAVSNTSVESTSEDKELGVKHISFNRTEPLSTYLFSFVAGKLYHTTYDDGEHRFTAYYRETDPERLTQLETIFAEIKASLVWLEDYTGIAYPFAKYDLIILPGFQYGGMEHTGATLYNDSQMFLSKNPTLDERLRRSQLIAHETAHMWFGDYVTMCWFDDVWTKEIFANYFAARIAEPLYPEINHRLNRLKTYTTSALNEDRTMGSTSIRQDLDNLRNAGLIYGQIIYNKAPIVMDKMVELMGEEGFRQGIREYLTTFAYGNATWPDLIAILDRYTDEDLATFSDVWVHQKGMPHISINLEGKSLIVEQHDPYNRGICWTQSFTCRAIYANGATEDIEVKMRDNNHYYELTDEAIAILPNICGRGYGLFIPEGQSLEWIMKNIATIDSELTRESLVITLNECYENAIITPDTWLNFLLNHIVVEQNYLIASTLNGYLSEVMIACGDTNAEAALWEIASSHPNTSLRRRLMMTLAHVATTESCIDKLYTTWHDMNNEQLDELDYMTLAYELSVRLPELRDEICSTQASRIANPDRRAQFDYISRATTADISERDSLFEWLLSEPENRRPEPWAASMLALLNHHTRQEDAVKYIYPGLDALLEVQRTGDIFFPRNWVGALLGGHHSEAAHAELERFFEDNPKYPILLKNKILQAAD